VLVEAVRHLRAPCLSHVHGRYVGSGGALRPVVEGTALGCAVAGCSLLPWEPPEPGRPLRQRLSALPLGGGITTTPTALLPDL
jgi:hypothetical protein